jgi:hypothetical protein
MATPGSLPSWRRTWLGYARLMGHDEAGTLERAQDLPNLSLLFLVPWSPLAFSIGRA